MFGLVLKNTILIILIILIVHFMIKNALLDKDIFARARSRNRKPRETNDNQLLRDALYAGEESDAPRPGLASRKREDILKYDEGYKKKCKEQQMKELYHYVFKDDASPELASFYDKSSVDMSAALDPNQQVKCEPSENTNLTCGPAPLCPTTIDKHFNERTKSTLPHTQDKHFKNRQIINEYADEDIMNGGAVDNLMGYDGFHSQYADIAL
jgi:hypothetical protein